MLVYLQIQRSGNVPGIGMVHAPFALLPMPFPESHWKQACEVAPIFSELFDRVSLDAKFLHDSLSRCSPFFFSFQKPVLYIIYPALMCLLNLNGLFMISSTVLTCSWSLTLSISKYQIAVLVIILCLPLSFFSFTSGFCLVQFQFLSTIPRDWK